MASSPNRQPVHQADQLTHDDSPAVDIDPAIAEDAERLAGALRRLMNRKAMFNATATDRWQDDCCHEEDGIVGGPDQHRPHLRLSCNSVFQAETAISLPYAPRWRSGRPRFQAVLGANQGKLTGELSPGRVR